MKIETKFDIEEEVYFFDGDEIKKGKIFRIYVTYVNDEENFIDYDIEGIPERLTEKQLFKTTKDLYKHVEKEIKKLLKGE